MRRPSKGEGRREVGGSDGSVSTGTDTRRGVRKKDLNSQNEKGMEKSSSIPFPVGMKVLYEVVGNNQGN